MSRFQFKKRRQHGTRRGAVPSARTKRYVVGYRGGRPGYGAMARNAWPLRSGPGLRTRSLYGKRKSIKTPDGNFTKSYCKKSTRKASRVNKLAMALTADHTIRTKGAKRVTGAVGQQGIWSHLFQCGIDNSQANDGSHIAGEDAVFTSSDGSIMYKKSTKCEMSITNVANTLCKVDIYDLECKDDAPSTSGYKNPQWYWRQAADENFNVGNNTDYLVAHTPLPTGKNIFNKMWTVKKKSTCVLNAGQVHTHTYIRKLDKRVPRANLLGTNIIETGQQDWLHLIKGITYSVMIVVNGFPVNDAITDTNINYGPTALDVVYHHWSVFHRLNDNSRYYTEASNMLEPLGAIGSVSTMVDETGAPALFATA